MESKVVSTEKKRNLWQLVHLKKAKRDLYRYLSLDSAPLSERILINFVKKAAETDNLILVDRFKKVVKKIILIDLLYDKKTRKVIVKLIQSDDNCIYINDFYVFKRFCEIHGKLPIVRAVYDGDSKINITWVNSWLAKRFRRHISALDKISWRILSSQSVKLVERNVYEVLLSEVFYKNIKDLKRKLELYFSKLPIWIEDFHFEFKLSTYKEDVHWHKDNVLLIKSKSSRKQLFWIWIQLSVGDNFDKKVNHVLPWVVDELVVLNLNPWIDWISWGKSGDFLEYNKKLTKKYERRLSLWINTFTLWRIPFFAYEIETKLEDFVAKVLWFLLQFILLKIFDKNRILDFYSNSKSDYELIDNIEKFFDIWGNSYIWMSYKVKSVDVKIIWNCSQNKLLIIKWDILNNWVVISNMSYVLSLSKLSKLSK